MPETLDDQKYHVLERALLDYVEKYGPTKRVLEIYSTNDLDRLSRSDGTGSQEKSIVSETAAGESA